MIKIIVLLLICVALAWVSEVQTRYNMHNKILYQKRKDLAFFLLCLVLSLFAGLRTDYNDTWNYIKGFRTATGLVEFLQITSPSAYRLRFCVPSVDTSSAMITS